MTLAKNIVFYFKFCSHILQIHEKNGAVKCGEKSEKDGENTVFHIADRSKKAQILQLSTVKWI